jgi:quercetin dioxygenase-like cupin family protein
LNLTLHEHPDGVTTEPGPRVVYDIEANEAHFGAARVDGPAIVWEIDVDDPQPVIVRCDRIDFPPGGIAYRHTHPGAGIRRLLCGSIEIDADDHVTRYGPGEAWFEGADYPVVATASADEPTAFVRVMVLPAEWEGKRTIRYLDPADEEKPKLQRPTVFFDQRLT